MSCETMRIIERQRVREDEEAKKKKKARQKKKINRLDSKRKIKAQAEKFGWIVKDRSRWSMILTKPNSQDRIEVDILKDRKIKFTVPGIISGMNHANADKFMETVTAELGAKVLQVVRLAKKAMNMAYGGAGLHAHHHGDGNYHTHSG